MHFETCLQIDRRRCVVWRDDLGSNGGWDGDLCTTVLNEQDSTVCECSTFGMFSVIAEMIEDPMYFALNSHNTYLNICTLIG